MLDQHEASSATQVDQRRPRLRNVMGLDVLEAVDPALLMRFLQPYAGYLVGRGVVLESISVNFEWIKGLHAVLCDVDPEMPYELQQALVDIGDLVGEPGHEEIVQTASAYGVVIVGEQDRPLSSIDLAFKTYLDHRAVFLQAHARAHAKTVKRFVEHYASANTRLPLAGYQQDGAGVAALKAQIGAWFADKNHTGYADIVVNETADEVTFDVIHGRTPRSHGIIGEKLSRRRLSYVADKHDLVVYHRATGRLSVNAQFVSHQKMYRQVFGEVFFDDKNHFRTLDIFTGDPLLRQGHAALSVNGVPGLRHVLLHEVSLTLPHGAYAKLSAVDVMPDFETMRTAHKEMTIEQMKFELAFAGRRRRPLLVEVVVPNKLVFDRRVDETPVRGFLQLRGFQRPLEPI